MAPGRVWFVAERFEALAALLMARGYALDAGARDPNEWNELAVEEPSRGIVRMKGIRLDDPADPDSAFDPGVSFSILEYWTLDPVEGSLTERGWLLPCRVQLPRA